MSTRVNCDALAARCRSVQALAADRPLRCLVGRDAAALVYEAADGVLVVYNGITLATRIAKFAPGAIIRVEVVGKLRRPYASEPKVGDFPP